MTAPCGVALDHGVVGSGRVLTLVAPSTVGLFSEDIEPRTGRLLGTIPQAHAHVGLINTAVTISELIEARDARFRAWS